MKEKVTAIITSYERESNVVENAIISVENQTFDIYEIILVDNNVNESYSNALLEMLKRHTKVQYFKCDKRGACAARNVGIKNAHGDYIGFLDDDDLWVNNKIERQIDQFRKHKDAGMVYCGGIQKNIVTGEEKDYFTSRYHLIKEITTYNDLLENDIIGSTSQPLIKKECFDNVGGFMENQPARQDYEMWLRISRKYKVIGLDEKLFVYVRHSSDQITKSQKKANIGIRNVYKKYKNDFKKNKEAYANIINSIYRTTDKKNIPLFIYYGFLKFVDRVKNKL